MFWKYSLSIIQWDFTKIIIASIFGGTYNTSAEFKYTEVTKTKKLNSAVDRKLTARSPNRSNKNGIISYLAYVCIQSNTVCLYYSWEYFGTNFQQKKRKKKKKRWYNILWKEIEKITIYIGIYILHGQNNTCIKNAYSMAVLYRRT